MITVFRVPRRYPPVPPLSVYCSSSEPLYPWLRAWQQYPPRYHEHIMVPGTGDAAALVHYSVGGRPALHDAYRWFYTYEALGKTAWGMFAWPGGPL